MGILNKTLMALIALCFTSCYEAFTPKIDTKPVLCINSVITAGEPIEVSVTHTWLYTDIQASESHAVDDAVIKIYVNDELTEPDYLPKEGDHIRIVADSHTYGHAEAEVTIPVAVPVQSLEWDTTVKECGQWDYGEAISYICLFDLTAKMTITDPAHIENYYDFSYRPVLWSETDNSDDLDATHPPYFNSGSLYYEAEPIFSEHIGVLDAISGNDSYGFTFFTDRQFTGQSYTLNLQFHDMKFHLPESELIEDNLDYGLILTLNTVSLSYYNWCNYRWNVENGTISDLGDIGLGDPVGGYSNVSTGAGVVVARTRTDCTINLREFLIERFGHTGHGLGR